MHSHSTEAWTHSHVFLGERHGRNEARTWAVVALTFATMVIEIGGGTVFGSMALVADGWHMSTHVAALGVAALAYRFARRHAQDSRFTFGTGKLGELAAFASAVMLAMIALYIGIESLDRLVQPRSIAFGEAIPIAVLGLLVNVASVALLHDDHGHHHHGHDHAHDDHAHDHHDHGHHDHHAHAPRAHGHDTNFRAAYVHVLADALTSILAIAALVGARTFGLTWLDPAMGLVGTVVIIAWSASLVRSAGRILLDIVPEPGVEARIRECLETDGDRVTDLHLWQVGPGHRAAVVSIVTDAPQPPSAYKHRLAAVGGLSHLTIEVEPCPGHKTAA